MCRYCTFIKDHKDYIDGEIEYTIGEPNEKELMKELEGQKQILEELKKIFVCVCPGCEDKKCECKISGRKQKKINK